MNQVFFPPIKSVKTNKPPSDRCCHQNPLSYHLLRVAPALEIRVRSMISTTENNTVPTPMKNYGNTKTVTNVIFVCRIPLAVLIILLILLHLNF